MTVVVTVIYVIPGEVAVGVTVTVVITVLVTTGSDALVLLATH